MDDVVFVSLEAFIKTLLGVVSPDGGSYTLTALVAKLEAIDDSEKIRHCRVVQNTIS